MMGHKFKVGDRVRVFKVGFNGAMHRDGKVVSVLTQEPTLEIELDENGKFMFAHVKQCRRLIKKEMLWVSRKELNHPSHPHLNLGAQRNRNILNCEEGDSLVAFLEVLKK